MNLFDRVVMELAPERGLRRLRARAQARVVMNYDAASKGRRTYGWKAPGSAADAAALGQREQLRNLARDMIRNRAWAARAQAVVTGNVVGTGILPSVVAESATVRDAVSEVVRRHLMTPAIDALGESALPSLQRIVMNTVFSDGEILVRRRMRDLRREPGLSLPFQVQLMEADHLDTTLTSYGRNRVVEGAEIGPTGRVEAYHLFDAHPGDAAWWARRRMTSTRVPAADILHIRRIDRPGQLRGVPWLAPIMMTLGEISDYQEAQILKQRMAALLAAVVTAGEDGKPYNGQGIEELAPGAVLGLSEGQTVTFSDPPTVDGYGDFMREGLGACAMGIGITREALTGDLSGVNFSSGRMGRMEMDRLVETWQQHLMIDQFCTGLGRWTDEAWPLGAGRRHRVDGWTLEWTAPRRALIDPTKEIPAMAAAVDAGLTSRQRQQRQLGYDPDLIRRERAEDAQKDEAAGLSAPAPATDAGTGPAPQQDEEGQSDEGQRPDP